MVDVQQAQAVHVLRVVLRKEPSDAVRIVRKMNRTERSELAAMAACAHELREQAEQVGSAYQLLERVKEILQAAKERFRQDQSGPET